MQQRGRFLPVGLLGLTLALELAAVGLSWGLEPRFDTITYAVYAVVLAGAGAAIATRHPRNPIGWLLCGFAPLNALASDAAQGWGLRAAELGWGGGPAAEWVSLTSWLASGYGWILTFLLFPDGHLPGRRWRAVSWVAAAGLLLAVPGWALSPDRAPEFAAGRSPLSTDAVPTGDPLLGVGPQFPT